MIDGRRLYMGDASSCYPSWGFGHREHGDDSPLNFGDFARKPIALIGLTTVASASAAGAAMAITSLVGYKTPVTVDVQTILSTLPLIFILFTGGLSIVVHLWRIP